VSFSTLGYCSPDTHLYVVLLVVRIHHAVVYDMPTAAAPENAMANNKKVRVSDGLYVQRMSVSQKLTRDMIN
jgi:hypothetical protein